MPKNASLFSDSDRTLDISKVFVRNQGCNMLQFNREIDPEQKSNGV